MSPLRTTKVRRFKADLGSSIMKVICFLNYVNEFESPRVFSKKWKSWLRPELYPGFSQAGPGGSDTISKHYFNR